MLDMLPFILSQKICYLISYLQRKVETQELKENTEIKLTPNKIL